MSEKVGRKEACEKMDIENNESDIIKKIGHHYNNKENNKYLSVRMFSQMTKKKYNINFGNINLSNNYFDFTIENLDCRILFVNQSKSCGSNVTKYYKINKIEISSIFFDVRIKINDDNSINVFREYSTITYKYEEIPKYYTRTPEDIYQVFTDEIQYVMDKKDTQTKVPPKVSLKILLKKKSEILSDMPIGKIFQTLINKYIAICERSNDVIIKCDGVCSLISKKDLTKINKEYVIINWNDVKKDKDATRELFRYFIDEYFDIFY
jgi:hypothetical protein